jgi:hypothetical protein
MSAHLGYNRHNAIVANWPPMTNPIQTLPSPYHKFVDWIGHSPDRQVDAVCGAEPKERFEVH